jgi:hypothetical protein
MSPIAYDALLKEVEKRRLSNGHLAEALRLYHEDFVSLKSRNIRRKDAEIEADLLKPTNVQSFVDFAEKNFATYALDYCRRANLIVSSKGWLRDIFIGVISNILFVIFCIVLFAVANQQVADVIQALGIKQETSSVPPKQLDVGPDASN